MLEASRTDRNKNLRKRNIWVDTATKAPYVVVRLLVTFLRETLKGIRCETGTAPQR